MSARVLFLDCTNGIGVGGGQRSLQLLLEELDPRFEPILACPPRERLLDGIPRHVRAIPLPLPGEFQALSRRHTGWRSAFGALPDLGQTVAHLRDILRRERPAIIHSNNLKMHLLAAAASTGLGIPRLWHLRDILPVNSLTATVKRVAAQASTRVLAVSRAVAQQLPGSHVQVLYNAVRLPDVSRLPALRAGYRRRRNIPADSCVIGYAGRLDRGKGLHSLIHAFAQTHATQPHTRLIVAGEGPERASLETLAHNHRFQEAIHFIGFENDLQGFYSALDIAAAPSNEPDSFPRSVIEAMAHSLPVIGTASGGIPEAIENAVTGFVLPPGDTAALARAIDGLSSSAPLRRQFGRAARLRAEREFSAEAQSRSLAQIYRELIPAA